MPSMPDNSIDYLRSFKESSTRILGQVSDEITDERLTSFVTQLKDLLQDVTSDNISDDLTLSLQSLIDTLNQTTIRFHIPSDPNGARFDFQKNKLLKFISEMSENSKLLLEEKRKNILKETKLTSAKYVREGFVVDLGAVYSDKVGDYEVILQACSGFDTSQVEILSDFFDGLSTDQQADKIAQFLEKVSSIDSILDPLQSALIGSENGNDDKRRIIDGIIKNSLIQVKHQLKEELKKVVDKKLSEITLDVGRAGQLVDLATEISTADTLFSKETSLAEFKSHQSQILLLVENVRQYQVKIFDALPDYVLEKRQVLEDLFQKIFHRASQTQEKLMRKIENLEQSEKEDKIDREYVAWETNFGGDDQLANLNHILQKIQVGKPSYFDYISFYTDIHDALSQGVDSFYSRIPNGLTSQVKERVIEKINDTVASAKEKLSSLPDRALFEWKRENLFGKTAFGVAVRFTEEIEGAVSRARASGGQVVITGDMDRVVDLEEVIEWLENKVLPNFANTSNEVKLKIKDYVDLQINRFKQAKDVVQGPEILKARARSRVEQLWNQVVSSEQTSKHTVNNSRVYDAYTPEKKNIDTAGILSLVEHFFPDELRRWELMVKIQDGFQAGANSDIFQQFAWADCSHSREKAAGHVDFDNIIEFGEMDEVKPVMMSIERYFQRPQTYIGSKGVEVTHDYAKDGNPNADQKEKGALDISDLLKRDHPELVAEQKSSIISAVQLVGIIGELRLKYYARYYANYLKSPDGTFDVSPIVIHSPMSALLYKIRANGNILPDLRLLWQIMRFPKNHFPHFDQNIRRYREVVDPVFVENASNVLKKRGLNRDKKKHPNKNDRYLYSTVARKPIQTTYSGLEDEFIPGQTPDKLDLTLYNFAAENENVLEAMQVRSMVDYGLTTSDKFFTPVRLDRTLTIIPFYWDIMFEKDPETGKRKYGAITYSQYNKTLEKWNEFLHIAQYPDPLTSADDVNDRIGKVISALSPCKALFGVMPKDTEAGERFRAIIQQMMLRYIKHIYDQYDKDVGYSLDTARQTLQLKRDYFFDLALEEIEKQGTLEGNIKAFLLFTLKKQRKIRGKDNLFTRSPGNPLRSHLLGLIGGRRSRKRRSLLERYLKKPPEEKK